MLSIENDTRIGSGCTAGKLGVRKVEIFKIANFEFSFSVRFVNTHFLFAAVKIWPSKNNDLANN